MNLKEMNFKSIDNKYRPIPFWSWNEKLDTEETARQIRLMSEAGIGGYFMHARGGLQTPYMGSEWFSNVTAAVEEGQRHSMGAWAYDENGWPSGFGNGIVNGRGIEYQQKYLRIEPGEKHTERTICNTGGYHLYYDVNPFYVDTLDGEVTRVFIDEIYQPYYEKYKNSIEGFFTDEPQISRNGIPWSFIMPDEYQAAYGDDLLPRLYELFYPVGSYIQTRFNFWKLVTDLFSNNFMKPIYDWCEERGLKLTGHLVLEESMDSQLTSNGAVMPHYEYFHIPGMDWLTRDRPGSLTMHQLCSVAHQLGKKQILTETFALCGHGIGFDGMKGLLERQMVRGVTLLCQHLQGYSLRGIRKRDYPPALFYQQPWWDEYKMFNDAMSGIGMLLTEGTVSYDTLVIHPQSTAWVCYDDGGNQGLEEYNNALLEIMDGLDKKHILYHLGDETIMERHARVEGRFLVIGTQRYSTVIIPPHKILFENTKRLLEEYKANGGSIRSVEEISGDSIVSNPEITYTKRGYEGCDLYYFVNSTNEVQTAEIAKGSKTIDITTGETVPFYGTFDFQPGESLMVIDDKSPRERLPERKERKALGLDGTWQLKSHTPNALTLDYCDYYFDGVLVEENGYVLNIQQRACALKRSVVITCQYKVQAEAVPDDLCLACETPEAYTIKVNDQAVNAADCGFFADISFRKIAIARYMKPGENIITLTSNFSQSSAVYENLVKAEIFESEKNKLTYDMEIEPVYLIGSFLVQTDGAFAALEKDAVRYWGGFTLAREKTAFRLQNLEQQGYPFFAGSMTFEKNVHLDSTDYKLKLNKKGVNAVKVRVNGDKESLLLWAPFELDLSSRLAVGENRIEITLINNLRNLLGPHHLEAGESYVVAPPDFYKEQCVWNSGLPHAWNDGYCFVETGIE